MVQVLGDRPLERWHASERPATDSHPCDLQKPALDEIQPGAACRNEMKVHPRMTSEPPSYRWAFVRAQIVQDQMQWLPLRCGAVEAPQEPHKLLTAVAPPALSDHDAIQDPQRGIQRRRPMPNVIVRLPLGHPRAEGQHRSRPIERLNPALLVHTEDHRPCGGFRYSPTTSRSRSTKCGSVDSLNRPTRCGCSPCCRQILRMVPSLSPCAFARGRLLQWVAAGGRVVSVACTTAWIFSGLICLRRPGREASRNSPGTPSITNRPAHNRTVIRLMCRASATDDGGS